MEAPCDCRFCSAPAPHLLGDTTLVWMECTRCGARGPIIDRTRPDAPAQAVAAWNTGKGMGRISVTAVPPGMPKETISLGARLQMIGEAMQKGEYGGPDGAVLVLREGAQARVVPHNVSPGDAARLLAAVLSDAQTRSRIGAVAIPAKSH